MFELFGWDIGMSGVAAILLVAGAVVIGLLAHLIGEVRTRWEGPIVAVAALIGGYVGSEALGTYSTWGFEFEGLFVLPALIGALAAGVAADVVVRFLTHGSYAHSRVPSESGT